MSLQVQFTILLPSTIPGVDAENIGPALLNFTDGSETLRRKKILEADKWTTLEVGDLVPWFFLIINDGQTTVDVGFGQGTPINIEPGDPPAFWPGSAIPSCRSDGGEGKIVYAVVAK